MLNHDNPRRKASSDFNIEQEKSATEEDFWRLEAAADELEAEGKLMLDGKHKFGQATIVRRINRYIRDSRIAYLQYIASPRASK